MAETDLDQKTGEESTGVELEAGTYEIIRGRLRGYAQELRSRLDKLNEERKQVFGSIDTTLLGTERITTAHNCVPRDLVAIGERFIFGYNVQFGLKNETNVEDVFSVYRQAEDGFHSDSLDVLNEDQFRRDFKEVYRYYKNVTFSRFSVQGPHLHMVFRVGRNATDIKSFKWLVTDNQLSYVDNRSDHEVRFPPQHEFEWIRTHRDLHQHGVHPHISIEDRVFVETVGGDLTIKIENNTESGEGIYSEDVENPDQTLDDAEIFYAVVGNIILLKIRPYQEKEFRYIVYNEKMQRAQRVDSIANACVLLPDDHGLIFSNGYYLQMGEAKTFETQNAGMVFERRIAAPNGEDYLYVFYNPDSGTYVLLHYNLIEQQVSTPIICHGATIFHEGELICFKSQDEPQKHHTIQIWQTPYVGEDYVAHTETDSFLFKVGNREIVRGMAECHEVLALIEKDDSYANLYVDIVRVCADILDSYFWLDKDETFHLNEVLADIREAGAAAVDEFDKVVRVQQATQAETKQVQAEAEEIVTAIHHRRFDKIDDFVTSLSDLRRARGNIISLRDLRYVDLTLVEKLESQVSENAERLSHRCVEYLLRDDALAPYENNVKEYAAQIDHLTKVSDAKALGEAISQGADELEMLIEIVSNLKIDDATHRTQIIDSISGIFSHVNAARASLKTKTKELLSVEGVAEFSSQMKLLNQGVVNYLDISDTPEKCEEFLTKVMIQLEELEGRFAEFDEFVLQLTEKREEVYNAFETRKLGLIEARNKRANSLMAAAERILKGIRTRVESFDTINEINGYFAADLMIEKIRDIVSELEELEDSVKVDDIQSRLKSVREDAVRQLKDRQELFVEGENVIKFGTHLFSVNVQPLDLTTVLREDEQQLHLTGTNFFESIEDEQLEATRDVWDQEVVSENSGVYRGEYLAFQLFREVRSGQTSSPDEFHSLDEAERLKIVQQFMAPRYSEAYAKGVHDADACKILTSLVEMDRSIGMLRYHTRARSLAVVVWSQLLEKKRRELLEAKFTGLRQVVGMFPDVSTKDEYVAETKTLLAEFAEQSQSLPAEFVDEAASYLVDELTGAGSSDGEFHGFAVSQTAFDIVEAFRSHLKQNGKLDSFDASLKSLVRHPEKQFLLAKDWAQGYCEQHADSHQFEYINEVASLLLSKHIPIERVVDGHVYQKLEGMKGDHKCIQSGTYELHFNEFLAKLRRYEHDFVPRYQSYIELKKRLVDESREEMRLDEFKPRVLTSFVRNKLIDSVYLPIVGDNLAKQMGVVGENKRTDLMGLLLLISPPGYGKTTLMEYIANRLGIVFMKINGPAIGHQVTSLDPAEAPNAGAREEVEKLNLSLEMGDNVMIYLDDIQHCNPEFLQKFISLCDAQRKIEGVYKGRTRTYDLRGRKVAVVMAGNPYTESGEKFQIPDMLSNRADIYNLGEIIGDSAEAFEMSYLENALTSNSVLAKLASRSQADVHAIIKMAETDTREGIDLEGSYSLEEISEYVATMQKLLRVRDVVLSVNRQYIDSAAQSDDYRTEPPFKLQGSYRNMNRIAEKVYPIMNDDELQSLILSNYENDAQTLTSDTEANLLKLRELLGILNNEQRDRWEDIKRTFKQNVKLRGIGSDDKFGQVVAQMGTFADGLDDIRRALVQGVDRLSAEVEPEVATCDPQLLHRIDAVQESLEAFGDGVAAAISEAQSNQSETTVVDAGTSDLAADAMIKLADELRSLTVGAIPLDSDRPTQRVSVMHKVPKSILDVVKSQFDVMGNWLTAIQESSDLQNSRLTHLQDSVDRCLTDYGALLDELNQANSRQKKS